MGKSDFYIFPQYQKLINCIEKPIESVAFLGFSKENEFTNSIIAKTRNFYDLSLNNWNINDEWELNQKYDLIVCTRCAYFSKDPDGFVNKCKQYLTTGGHALIDWGLGDHWRFKDYKVGWLRNNELEFAYGDTNFLYSCYWHDKLLEDENVKNFWNAVLKNPDFGYTKNDNLADVIKKEVPSLTMYDAKKIQTFFLWPEKPQLYIITLIENL
jgi:SAM-dependent methyltransferase